MTGNAPATDYKCNDYHQNDGAKGATITNATSTVAGYLPAARKVCPTTLADAETKRCVVSSADAETKRCVVSSADAENNRVVSSADAEQQGQNDKPAVQTKGVQTPTKEWLKAGRWVFCPRRALGPLPAPAPRSFFFPTPYVPIFFLPQAHSSWLMPTEGV